MQVQQILLFDSNKKSEGPQQSTSVESYLKENQLQETFAVTLHEAQMTEYTSLMGVSKYQEALEYLAMLCTKALETALKKEQVVCLMVDDPDNLGAALVAHFLLTATKASIKTMKQYSASKAIELVKSRRMNAAVLR